MAGTKKIMDIENPKEEFNKLTERFKLLQNRFLAIAMDYKHYVNGEITDHTIYELRDNVLYRLYSARFHFQLLLQHHNVIENRIQDFYKNNPNELFRDGFELTMIREQSTKEIYSLFDSLMYHLCSIYDYLFRLINFAHGKIILDKPKWNRFLDAKNQKEFIYCSEQLISKLKKIDNEFVYPLIGHRSHLIHTENDIGGFILDFNLGLDNFNAKFFATKLFKENFPEIQNEGLDLTIKYSALWLIDKTIKTTTEVLFELRDDMVRNKKNSSGMRVVLLGSKGVIQPVSISYWGERSQT